MSLFRKIGIVLRAAGRSVFAHPAARQQARHLLLSQVANRLGLRLYNHSLRWPTDPAVSAAWRCFAPGTAIFGERYFNLFYLARSTASVTGNTAECGVFKGAGSHMILSALAAPAKLHHVFDSFGGLSSPDGRDRATVKPAYQWEKGDLSVPEEIVRKNLAGFSNVQFHKGWIPERFADVAGETFSFVHIDVDLYRPTIDSIAFFYPRMAPGGVIVCDDYGSELCPGAHAAINDFLRDKPETVVHLTTGQGVVTKRCG